MLACGPSISRVTPTPTKTPKRVRTLAPIATDVPTQPAIVLPTSTPVSTDTSTPVPATDTPTPVPATDTPTPVPATDTPIPVPPTNTPVPPPPTQPPPPPPTVAPAPPPPPAEPETEIIIELPKGNVYSSGDEIEIIITARNPNGIHELTWGIFAQNLTPYVGGDKNCGGGQECRHEVKEDATLPPAAYIIGADVLDTSGKVTRGIAEVHIN